MAGAYPFQGAINHDLQFVSVLHFTTFLQRAFRFQWIEPGRVATGLVSRHELLDFQQKYLSGGDGKSGVKGDGGDSQGMLSLTRDINPALPPG